MNRRDQYLLKATHAVVHRIALLTPSNPVDPHTDRTALSKAALAADHLTWALAAHDRGDAWTADFNLEQAAKAVGAPGRRQCVKCGRSGGELTENGCPQHPRADIRWRTE